MWTSASGLYIIGGGVDAPPGAGDPLGDGVALARAVVGDDSGIALAWTGRLADSRDRCHARRCLCQKGGGCRRGATENASERRETERQLDDRRHRFSRVDIENLACRQDRLI